MGFLRRLLRNDRSDASDALQPSGEAEEAGHSGETGPDELEDSAGEPLHEDRQAVNVWIRLHDASFEASREQMRVFALEDRLISELDRGGVGTYDTNELTSGFLKMRMLGRDADAMVAAIRPLLVADAPAGSYLAIRRGPTGTSEERVEIAE